MGKFLRDVNTIMSIGAKAHYMSGGNVKKADPLAKPQYTLKKVAELLAVDYDELKTACVEQGIITEGGYILNNNFGQGEKFNEYFLRALLENEKTETVNNEKIENTLKTWSNKYFRCVIHIVTFIALLAFLTDTGILTGIFLSFMVYGEYCIYLSKHNPQKLEELMRQGNK